MSWILQRMLLFYYFSVWGEKSFRGCYHQGGRLSSSGFIKKGGTVLLFFFKQCHSKHAYANIHYTATKGAVMRNCALTFYSRVTLLFISRLREAIVTDLPEMTNNLPLLTISGLEAFLAFSSSPASTSLIMHVRQWISKGLLLQPLQPSLLYTFTLLSFFIRFYSLCVGIIMS